MQGEKPFFPRMKAIVIDHLPRSLLKASKNPFFAKMRAITLNEYPIRKIDHLFTSVAADRSAIPNIVYQTWEVNRLGRTHLKELTKFRKLNEDYSFEFFDNSKRNRYMEETYGDHPIYPIYQNAKFGPLKTDIWRYCILFQRGGIYFDINKSVDIPLRQIIQSDDKAVISFEQNLLKDYVHWEAPTIVRQVLQHPERIVLNWGLAFAPGHAFLSKTIQNIINDYPHWRMKVVPKVRDAIVQFTGPLMLTKSIWKVIEEDPEINFRQMGIDFNRHGIFDMHGSWSRYITIPAYAEYTNRVIIS